jgi:DNA-binding NarL/FixJ family response regulator
MTRILIADPDIRTRQALILLLERRLGANQAGEAWDRPSLERQLAALRPDTLLLDCHLPGLAADDLAGLLSRLSGARVALMSVDASDIAAAQSLNAAFIYKGALPDEVVATLRALIPA